MHQLPLFDDAQDDPHPDTPRAREIYERLQAAAVDWETTAVQETRALDNPFRTLIAGMLSARTREEDTRAATEALFALADTPTAMLALSDAEIEAAIRPVTYHHSKVGYIRGICEQLVANGGDVPRTLDELTALPGVGWKTAVLTQWMAFGVAEAICVDVHVGRIGRRLGLVEPSITQPQKVSQALMAVVPRALWGEWNPLMVRFGRAVCYPNQPACNRCPVLDLCPQVGV